MHDVPGRGADPGCRLGHIAPDGSKTAASASMHEALPDGLDLPAEIARREECLCA